jgi:hypothetical protein
MVPGAGIEPARRLKREILSLLCLPISPSGPFSNNTVYYLPLPDVNTLRVLSTGITGLRVGQG